MAHNSYLLAQAVDLSDNDDHENMETVQVGEPNEMFAMFLKNVFVCYLFFDANNA